MYSTVFVIVLFKIPYKYDRIKKTKDEKKAEKKKRTKKRAKRRGRKTKDIGKDMHLQVLRYQEEEQALGKR